MGVTFAWGRGTAAPGPGCMGRSGTNVTYTVGPRNPWPVGAARRARNRWGEDLEPPAPGGAPAPGFRRARPAGLGSAGDNGNEELPDLMAHLRVPQAENRKRGKLVRPCGPR